MLSSLKAFTRNKIPALRQRDERIAELESTLRRNRGRARRLTDRVSQLEARNELLKRAIAEHEAAARQSRAREAAKRRAQREQERQPSYYREILSLRNYIQALKAMDPQRRTVLRQTSFKLRNYAFAQSHGVATPGVLGIWGDVESIDLRTLLNQFVLKSDVGSSSQSVFPLHRVDQNHYRDPSGEAAYSEEWLRAEFLRMVRSGGVRGPFFAEEFLCDEARIGLIPPDIKIFAFYGEIGHVMVRTVGRHRDSRSFRYRFLLEDGTDLGKVSLAPRAVVDPEILIPDEFHEMLAIARHLSRAVGAPFMRVDLYGTPHGPKLGELTRSPGGHVKYRTEHDRRLGRLWIEARARLESDYAIGRPPGLVFGEHPYADYYEIAGSTDPAGSTRIRTSPCSEWCRASALH